MACEQHGVKQFIGDGRLTHQIPIIDRLPPLNKITSNLLLIPFVLTLLVMHVSQLALWPMVLVPGMPRAMYWDYILASKESFGRLLVWISRKTTLTITCDDSLDLDQVVQRDAHGRITGLKFARRAVWISNHQAYSDWVYTWGLFYKANLASALVIVLKASLRRVPVAGVAMRLWKFIFLGSWEKDKAGTGQTLFDLGRRATKDDAGLALLLYPEGTLVSRLTRPRSAAYAVKSGIADLKNQLLPRSTGLIFCLRALLPRVPDLALYDITVGYPGLPPAGYAQSFYTLGSIYTAGQNPPSVHLHIRRIDLEKEVPIGKVSKGMLPDEADEAFGSEERKVFDTWLREKWVEKDELLDVFYRDGTFPAKVGHSVVVPLELGGIDDWVAVLSNLIPAYLGFRAVQYAYGLYTSQFA